MKSQKPKIVWPTLAMVAVAFAIGCGTTSRYKGEQFGPKQEGKMEVALANMDKAMSDMEATKQAAMAKQQEALRLGKELFNDPNLGTKGLACNSCHPGGGTTGGETEIKKRMGHGPYKLPIPSLIGAAARFPKYKIPNNQPITLAQMNNNCIRMFMSGKRLPLNSPESFYLATYVSSLSEGDQVQVGGGTSQKQ
ncbi:hypothetical protein L0337_19935 [candidate division KSB1 bacterium]|nr:hypothetical protein [candidate division KSB1 bacterium]